MIAPSSTIGILGGGQLGRMLALAAAPLGYRCHIFCPEAVSPAANVAAAQCVARALRALRMTTAGDCSVGATLGTPRLAPPRREPPRPVEP